jgi:hypothetical protein
MRAYHMFAQPLSVLHEAARSIDVKQCWYDGSRKSAERRHYDLFGDALLRAFMKCDSGDVALSPQ